MVYSAPQAVTHTVPAPYTVSQPAPYRAPQYVKKAPQQFHGQNHVNAIESERVTGFQSYETKLASSAPVGVFNDTRNSGQNAGGFTTSVNGSFNASQSRPTGGFNGAFGGPRKTELPENERATEEQFYTGKDANGQLLTICFKCGANTGHKATECAHYPYCFICKVKSPRHSTKHCPFRGQQQPGQEGQRESFANM